MVAGLVNDTSTSAEAGAAEAATSIDVSAATVRRCDDGIIEILIRDGATVGVREMEAILAAQLQLTQGPVAVLVDARPVKSMTREAQELITGTASERKTRAVAILIDSPVSAFLGNFFLALSRPVYPTKLFRRADAARQWLLTHL